MESPEKSPETTYLVVVDPDEPDDEDFSPEHRGTDHGIAHNKAVSAAKTSGRVVRLFQELAAYEAETNVVMRKPGE
jgi:hypothetical protein